VYKIGNTGTFNVKSWTGSGGTEYVLSAVDGKLESSIHKIY